MIKILLVDDSDTVRLQLKKDLTNVKYTILEAADGLDGLNQLKADAEISLVICDINMPIMDGLTMCEKLSESGRNAGLTILMLTTETSAEMKERGKKAGVRAWITKPYQADKLIAAIEKMTQPKVN